MFLARIEGTVVATVKHSTLGGCRFLIAQRMEADGSLAAEPNLVVDWHGAAMGSTVIVSSDGVSRASDSATPRRRAWLSPVLSIPCRRHGTSKW